MIIHGFSILKGQCHQKCVSDRYNKLIDAKLFPFFCVSLQKVPIFKGFFKKQQLREHRTAAGPEVWKSAKIGNLQPVNHPDIKMLPECHPLRYKYRYYICVWHHASSRAGHPEASFYATEVYYCIFVRGAPWVVIKPLLCPAAVQFLYIFTFCENLEIVENQQE